MTTTNMTTANMTTAEHHEAIVVEAGVSGIYRIKPLADLGFDAIVIEADDDLGGTWYRNRYPGSRFDSESYTYGYSFSIELLAEWHWTERFSGQPENLRYLNHVADKFDLRRHMRFNCRVTSMTWDNDGGRWHLPLEDGRALSAAFVITSLGPLSIPALPRYGPVVPHLLVAQGSGCARGAPGRGDGHRSYRDPDHRRDRRQGRRATGLPAATEQEHTAQQRAHLRG